MTNAPSKFNGKKFSTSSLRTATSNDLARLRCDLLKLSPAATAMVTSYGRWQPARHLTLLDQVLREAIKDASAGLLDGLVVSMPPQHGKSELCSKYLPAWYLGMYPDRRVMLAAYEADFAPHAGRQARGVSLRRGPA